MLVCVTGGQWFFLQSFAWLGMVFSYAQTTTLREAFAMTFDGQHPCPVCKMVAESKKSEKRPDSPRVDTKLDFFLDAPPAILIRPARVAGQFALSTAPRPRAEAPPTPPPRPLLG